MSVIIEASPPRKRRKLDISPDSTVADASSSHQNFTGRRRISEVVLRRYDVIRKYLDVRELLGHTFPPEIDFLKEEEHEVIWNLVDKNEQGSNYLAARVLRFLKSRDESERDDDFRKFVACVAKAEEHRGHRELRKIFFRLLGDDECEKIKKILDSLARSPLPSPYSTPQPSPVSPEKPIALITLQGRVVEEHFIKTERELWLAFSTGKYNMVEGIVSNVMQKCSDSAPNGEYNVDCEIVAFWFQSLVLMHRDGQYEKAIEMLLDTEKLTAKSEENELILKGRIHQRMAQIYLMMTDQKHNAAKYFKLAKEELQFVGRGYDKTNMFCREAKILSATEPHRRQDIEDVYEQALSTLEEDDPYFLASFPSVTLSKAAFHLRVAFGAKPQPADTLPHVSIEDINKAKETLKTFSVEKHVLIAMRRSEYDFLQAELCRLEGRVEEAQTKFTEITRTIHSGKIKNILALAKHRMKWMSKGSELVA